MRTQGCRHPYPTGTLKKPSPAWSRKFSLFSAIISIREIFLKMAYLNTFRTFPNAAVTRLGLGVMLSLSVANAFAVDPTRGPTQNLPLSPQSANQAPGSQKTPPTDTVEVTRETGNYIVTLNNKQTYIGNSFTGAMLNAAGDGNRVINVRTSGITTKPIRLYPHTTLNWLTRSFWNSHVNSMGDNTGATLYAVNAMGIRINGLKMLTTSKTGPGFGIRLASCSGARIENVLMDFRGRGPSAAIRVDNSGNSRIKANGLYIRNVEIRNTAEGVDSQGIDTFGVNNIDIDNVKGVNLGGSACVLRAGEEARIGTVTGIQCGWGRRGAALEIAHRFSNCYVEKVISDGKGVGGRGLFILNSTDITVNSVDIRNNKSQGIAIHLGGHNTVNKGTVTNAEIEIVRSHDSFINVNGKRAN
jgi:hypothetical protein